MEVYLIRHTTPSLTPGLIYGRMEVGLTDTFEEELIEIQNKIPAVFDKIYSSPSSRCVELAKRIDPNFMVDDHITELDFGEWEGKTWDTVDQSELQRWMDNFVNISVPGGESLLRMHERVGDFWNEVKNFTDEKTAIITHAGVIRLIMAIENKTPLDQLFNLKVDYGQVFVLNI